jgi:mannose-6-phosphate isomerase-like protein (cupin superfamily)
MSLLSTAAAAQRASSVPTMPIDTVPAAAGAKLRTSISAAEIADRIRQAEAAAKSGTQHKSEPLLQSGPFRAHLEYHSEAASNFAVHENEAELFVVLDGSGTLTVGGTLVNPTRQGNNLIAAIADGGVPHKVVKGDMMLVPENTPHAVTQVDGKLVLMSLHLPLPHGVE